VALWLAAADMVANLEKSCNKLNVAANGYARNAIADTTERFRQVLRRSSQRYHLPAAQSWVLSVVPV